MYAKTVYEGPDLVSALGLMPIDKLGIKMNCPSMFTKSKWCIRKLTVREIAECFDQPSTIIDKCVIENIRVNQLPLVKTVPNKILQYILRRLSLSNIEKIETEDQAYQSSLPIEEKHLKAVKSDDAAVDTYIWDDRVLKLFPTISYTDETVNKLNILRRFFLRLWVRRLCRSFQSYLRN